MDKCQRPDIIPMPPRPDPGEDDVTVEHAANARRLLLGCGIFLPPGLTDREAVTIVDLLYLYDPDTRPAGATVAPAAGANSRVEQSWASQREQHMNKIAKALDLIIELILQRVERTGG